MANGVTAVAKAQSPSGSLAISGMTALGVVFGDKARALFTSSETVLAAAGGKPDAVTRFGRLSLIFWTYTIITPLNMCPSRCGS